MTPVSATKIVEGPVNSGEGQIIKHEVGSKQEAGME